MPLKPVVGLKRIAAACAGDKAIAPPLDASIAGVISAKPPTQVAPVIGQGTLSTPCAAVGTLF